MTESERRDRSINIVNSLIGLSVRDALLLLKDVEAKLQKQPTQTEITEDSGRYIR